MSRVLVVDDEAVYRDELALALASDGHETETAANGREAIDKGLRFRPDVLLTDWMLRNHVHGLHVVEVLREVTPRLRPILMTGFASDDLRRDAQEARVFDFVEKPFERDRILAKVRDASERGAHEGDTGRLAVLEIDADGTTRFANPRARALMDEVVGPGTATAFADLFDTGQTPDLDEASKRWIAATPRSPGAAAWRVRSQAPRDDGSRLAVLYREDEVPRGRKTIVEMLLGMTDPVPVSWPFEGRILIIDDQAMLRRLFVSSLEAAGAGCCAVESPSEALRLLASDPGLRFVLHDFEMPGVQTSESVRAIKSVRPEVLIIGSSGKPHREAFAAMGVEHYLPKPWLVGDLVDVLCDRLGACGECGITLPLRNPLPGEVAESWACAMCGSRYRAVFDNTMSEDVGRNARQAP